MDNQKVIIHEDKNFASYKIDNIGIMKIKSNVFDILTDLPESSKFIQSMDTIEYDRNLRAMLILNEKNSLGNNEYIKYLNRVFSHNNKRTNSQESNRMARTRQLVIENRLIKKIVQSNKLIVNASRGEIVTPFFGAALAADLRLASEDAVFLLSHSKMSVHPSGALPYFLPKYVGHAKASQILYSIDKITAREALELGILYELLPSHNFEELCINKTSQILTRDESVITSTKSLLMYNFKDLDKYLNIEEHDYRQR